MHASSVIIRDDGSCCWTLALSFLVPLGRQESSQEKNQSASLKIESSMKNRLEEQTNLIWFIYPFRMYIDYPLILNRFRRLLYCNTLGVVSDMLPILVASASIDFEMAVIPNSDNHLIQHATHLLLATSEWSEREIESCNRRDCRLLLARHRSGASHVDETIPVAISIDTVRRRHVLGAPTRDGQSLENYDKSKKRSHPRLLELFHV